MSKPERQHFIPKSYLNNFGIEEGDKCFIHGKRKNSDEIKRLSTKDICLERNLYTIPTNDETKKFDIEHFYANNVDNKFSFLYDFLTNRENDYIDFETRLKIISTSLSLYFRTPKFLNIQNKIFENIVKDLFENPEIENLEINLFGEKTSITRKEAEDLIKEKKESNRIKFLFQHLISYEKFVQSKLLDTIWVYHVYDETELITCDNPVIIRPNADPTKPNFDFIEYENIEIDPFNPTNIIYLPINNKTLLAILPKIDIKPNEYIRRLEIGKIDVLMYNSDIQKYSEDWILGSKESIENHLKDQLEYNVENEENLKLVNDYQDKVIQLNEMTILMEKHGVKSPIVLDKIEQMKKQKHISEDKNFQNIVKAIETNKK
jgi:hypothetical protein